MRLVLMYKAIHHLVVLDTFNYLVPLTQNTRQHQYHDLTFRHISTSTNYHKYSFYPCTIPLWNSLPASIAEAPTADYFKAELAGFAIPANFM